MAEVTQPQREAVLAQYRPIRAALQAVLDAAADRCRKPDFDRAAKHLDLVDPSQLQSEQTVVMIADIALFEPNQRGRRVIDRFVEERADALPEPERAIARRLPSAFFSIFRIAGWHEAGGVWLEDLLAARRIWLMDESLEATAPEGLVIGLRVFDAGPFHAGFGIVVHPDAEAVAFCTSAAARGEPPPVRHSLAAALYGDAIAEATMPATLDDILGIAEALVEAQAALAPRPASGGAGRGAARRPVGTARKVIRAAVRPRLLWKAGCAGRRAGKIVLLWVERQVSRRGRRAVSLCSPGARGLPVPTRIRKVDPPMKTSIPHSATGQAAYAHSRKDRPVQEWELLPVHADEVGQATADRAAKFGCTSMGRVLGRLHDFGKFKLAFQRYLHDPTVKEKGHSTAGAVYAFRRLPEPFGRILAHAVAGHHAGLGDALLTRDGRLDRGQAELDLALAGYAAAPGGYALPAGPDAPDLKPDGADLTGFQFHVLIRMLFSCLVDADRACTARFYQRDVEPWPRATLEDLSAALSSAMEREEQARRQRGEDRRAVNLRRAEILAAVRAHAGDAPGVFTLTVPTGGGKTLTGLDFALRHALANGLDRVIVVIPFTSVIEQTAAVYRAALGDLGGEVLEHHSAFDEGDLRGEHRQGEDKLRLAMENWDARIVVTTAVQFFESLFSNRPSQCRKLHNLARSVVILDEAQTIPLPLLRPCVAMLRELVRNYRVSLVLSSATQPALLERPQPPDEPVRSFEGGFPACEVTELAPDPPRLFALMRRVTVVAVDQQDDAALAERMARADGEQALCIVNTRRHARELFRAIADEPGARHLSTMMHAEHRSRVLAEIKADLTAGRPCRVVSTSLIEAGVDVDFPLVLRAETGADQFAQAAGRLNREGRRGRDESLLLLFKPVGQWAHPAMQANVEAGRSVLRQYKEACLGPEAIEAYFRQLYWKRGDAGLDAPGILNLCHRAGPTLDFPFVTIADGMRLIDQATRPVIVATDAESRRWLAELKDPGSREALRTITRGLQRYVVGLPRRDHAALLRATVAQPVRPEVFGDQFVELVNMNLYKPDIGLDCSDPYFMESGGLVV